MSKKEGWFYGVSRHFQQYFSSIVAVSFIGGGNWRTRRKPLTYDFSTEQGSLYF
jgi:hypothetical protein